MNQNECAVYFELLQRAEAAEANLAGACQEYENQTIENTTLYNEVLAWKTRAEAAEKVCDEWRTKLLSAFWTVGGPFDNVLAGTLREANDTWLAMTKRAEAAEARIEKALDIQPRIINLHPESIIEEMISVLAANDMRDKFRAVLEGK